MAFDRIVEALIREALERGEFDNLPGKGKPLDLTEYFETREEVRLAHWVLKNAGMTSGEVQLLATVQDERKKQPIMKQIQEQRKSQRREK